MRKTDLFKTNVEAKYSLFSIFCICLSDVLLLLTLLWLAKLLWSIGDGFDVGDECGTNIILGFGLCCNAKFEWWQGCINTFVLTLVLSSLCLLLSLIFSIVSFLLNTFGLFRVELIFSRFLILEFMTLWLILYIFINYFCFKQIFRTMNDICPGKLRRHNKKLLSCSNLQRLDKLQTLFVFTTPQNVTFCSEFVFVLSFIKLQSFLFDPHLIVDNNTNNFSLVAF